MAVGAISTASTPLRNHSGDSLPTLLTCSAVLLLRMVTMCGASLPRKFTKIVQRFEDNPDALRDAGIAYAIDQIVDLVTDGVDGIHLYTMNNPYVARKISEAVGGIIKAATKC